MIQGANMYISIFLSTWTTDDTTNRCTVDVEQMYRVSEVFFEGLCGALQKQEDVKMKGMRTLNWTG